MSNKPVTTGNTIAPQEYQTLSALTLLPQVKGNASYLALGLCTESAEIADLVKRAIRQGIPATEIHEFISIEDVKNELGDLLWYLVQFASLHNLTLEEIMQANVEKLQHRQATNTLHNHEKPPCL